MLSCQKSAIFIPHGYLEIGHYITINDIIISNSGVARHGHTMYHKGTVVFARPLHLHVDTTTSQYFYQVIHNMGKMPSLPNLTPPLQI